MQQIRVVATYEDGKTRDVTREAFIESGNTEVAVTSRTALMTAVRRGEAPCSHGTKALTPPRH